MAKKQKKGDIDWEAFINSFDDAEFDQLLRNRAARKGTDGILELLSPKMREEMLRRLQTEFSNSPGGTMANESKRKTYWRDFEAMATKKQKDEFNWGFVLERMAEQSPKKLVEGGSVKVLIDKIGVDGLWSLLTPEQRHELAKRMESEKK